MIKQLVLSIIILSAYSCDMFEAKGACVWDSTYWYGSCDHYIDDIYTSICFDDDTYTSCSDGNSYQPWTTQCSDGYNSVVASFYEEQTCEELGYND